MLLHRQGVVGAALDRRVVGDDHAQSIADTTEAGNHTRSWRFIAVKAIGSHGGDLQEGRTIVEQRVDPITREQLPSLDVALT